MKKKSKVLRLIGWRDFSVKEMSEKVKNAIEDAHRYMRWADSVLRCEEDALERAIYRYGYGNDPHHVMTCIAEKYAHAYIISLQEEHGPVLNIGGGVYVYADGTRARVEEESVYIDGKRVPMPFARVEHVIDALTERIDSLGADEGADEGEDESGEW